MESRPPAPTPGARDEDYDAAAAFVRGESRGVVLVDTWIARATAPFRRNLADEWDDVRQEIRIEVLGLLRDGRYRGESSLKTYVWRVAAHTCLDALRRRRRRPPTEPETAAEPLVAPGPTPLDRLVEAERERQLLCVLEAMAPECRELWRHILEGRGYREIAGRLGVAEGTLRVRAHRCRKAAEQKLGNAGEGGSAHE